VAAEYVLDGASAWKGEHREQLGDALAGARTGRYNVHLVWSGVWSPAARKAGFPSRTGRHRCRHLFASALIRYGESVKTVQHLMAHSSPAITLSVYALLWPDSDERARLAVGAAFADVPSVCPAVGED